MYSLLNYGPYFCVCFPTPSHKENWNRNWFFSSDGTLIAFKLWLSPLGTFIGNCKFLLTKFADYKITKVAWQQNFCANILAKEGRRLKLPLTVYDHAPEFILHQYYEERTLASISSWFSLRCTSALLASTTYLRRLACYFPFLFVLLQLVLLVDYVVKLCPYLLCFVFHS